MSDISKHEAGIGLIPLLEELDRAGEVIITRGGEPVARLVPTEPHCRAADILEKARSLRSSIAARGERFHWDELKALRDEERP